jgi:hypothetical protein
MGRAYSTHERDEMHAEFLFEILRVRDHLEGLGIDG